MKRILALLILTAVFALEALSQSQCTVLMEGIGERYDGECRNGLAHGNGEAWGVDHYYGAFKKGFPHGKGTYEYADGSVYKGFWSKGQRHGAGNLTFVYNGADTIQDGLWTRDEFKGNQESVQGYSVVRMRAIERYRVIRLSDGNEIRIHFKPVSSGTLDISNLQITGSSGYETEFMNSQMEFRDCEYPFKLRVSFNKWSKLKTVRVDASIELEILHPGIWMIDIGT